MRGQAASMCLAGPVLVLPPARVLFGTAVCPETEKRTHAQAPSLPPALFPEGSHHFPFSGDPPRQVSRTRTARCETRTGGAAESVTCGIASSARLPVLCLLRAGPGSGRRLL